MQQVSIRSTGNMYLYSTSFISVKLSFYVTYCQLLRYLDVRCYYPTWCLFIKNPTWCLFINNICRRRLYRVLLFIVFCVVFKHCQFQLPIKFKCHLTIFRKIISTVDFQVKLLFSYIKIRLIVQLRILLGIIAIAYMIW